MDVTPACHAQSQIRCRLRRFRHQPIVIQGYAAMNRSTRSSTSVLLPRILQKRAADPADRWSYAFLDSQGGEQCRWTAGDLAARTRAIAAHIGRVTSPGEPVLLVFQAWPEFLRSEEHKSELQSLLRLSYAVFCLNNNQLTNSKQIN